MSTVSFGEVVERLKAVLGVSSDAALAAALGLKPTAYNNRKVAGSIPHEAVQDLCVREGISLDAVYGITSGKQPMGQLLSKDERELLEDFRELDKADRNAIKRQAAALRMMRK